jgi:glycosyltransferase involved in cell wall biosynthesis
MTGGRAREAYFARPDVREAFPLGLLPDGYGSFFRWLVRHGCDEMGLRLEECWWWLLSTNENQAAEVVRIYLMSPSWQLAHPAGLTRFGSAALAAWIADSYGISPDATWLQPSSWHTGLTAADELRIGFAAHRSWQLACPDGFTTPDRASALLEFLAGPKGGLPSEDRAWCDARRTDGTASLMANVGLNVIGHFCYPSGLRVSVEALSEAIELAGIAVSRRDVRTSPNDDPQHSYFAGVELHDITVIHVQPEPFFSTVYQRADLSPRHPRTYRIAYWYWELETAPAHWVEIASTVDEVWVATRFVAAALRRALPVPVRIVFPGIKIGRFMPLAREAFDIPGWQDGHFTFLFSFHMASVMERKNPLGLIEAFRRAFRSDEPVVLILKTTSSPQHAHDLQRLHDAAEGANIRVVDQVMSSDRNLALMNAVDAYVSLHRSEGLGLTMAEAMLLGKPVIATRYGGNLDFMDDNNSLLVDCELITLDAAEPPYDAGCRWAQPSISIAASLMRRLFDDPVAAAALGARGRTDALRRMSPESAGAQAATYLRSIYAARCYDTATTISL